MRPVMLLICIVSGCDANGARGPLPAFDPVPGEGVDASGAASESDSIQGGAKDAKDPAVGLVWIRGGGFCTGTLIAPNVVLTAGHCVADPVAAFYTGTGKGAVDVGRLPAAGFVEHRVVDQVAHPDYQDANVCPNPTFDVGLLRLEAPLGGTAPVMVATQPPRVGATCRTVGYGVHGSNGRITIEQKRSATERVSGLDDSSVQVARKSGIVDHGDSGGPLVCGKKIVGVTSCGNQGSPNQREAYYGRVDGIGDWIDQTIAGWQ